jgi:hypothetical protein
VPAQLLAPPGVEAKTNTDCIVANYGHTLHIDDYLQEGEKME